MKSYKQYSCLFIAIIGLFVILNFICWHFFTSQSFEAFEHTGHGDILRMGGLPYIVSHTGQSPYSYHHTGFWEYLDGGEEGHFDIITIGDSFSNDGGGAYYQDILSSEYGYSILNMPERLDAISTLYVLNERGYIDVLLLNPVPAANDNSYLFRPGSMGLPIVARWEPGCWLQMDEKERRKTRLGHSTHERPGCQQH